MIPQMEASDPKHVAIILDGNRRYAKKLLLEPWKGHDFGKKKVEELMDYAKELGIKEMTFYALSAENIKNRSSIELNFIYKLFRETFHNMDRDRLNKNRERIRFIGDIELLPEDLQEECKKLEEDTKENNKFVANFCIAYGGRQELVHAVRRIVESKVKSNKIDVEVITNNLYLNSEPDIVIRTGGDKRTSNFLPWQSVYSEWFFLDKMWPEFDKEDLIECIWEFKNRKRNFGK